MIIQYQRIYESRFAREVTLVSSANDEHHLLPRWVSTSGTASFISTLSLAIQQAKQISNIVPLPRLQSHGLLPTFQIPIEY